MVKNSPALARDWVGTVGGEDALEEEMAALSRILAWEIPWRRKWQPSPGFLPGKFHGQRSLAGYSPWSSKELDTTEYAHINNI